MTAEWWYLFAGICVLALMWVYMAVRVDELEKHIKEGEE